MKKTPQSIRITGLAYLVAFLVLAFSIGAQTTNWDDTLLAYLIDSGDINEEMAELLRTNCRIELLDARKTLENHELHLLVRSSTSKGPLIAASSRKEMRGMVNSLHLLVKQPLLDCLRETSLVRPVAGEEIGPKNTWYDRYLGFLFTHNPSSSRRRELAQVSAEAPATSPEVSSSPPAAFPFFPPTDNSDEEPTVEDQTSDVRSRNEENTKRTIIIAVVVTASVTFVFSSLLFVFCRKCSGSGSGQGRNDESPLLSLSLSEYSIASSRKSYGVGTTVNNEKPGSQSFNKLNHNKNSGNFYMESHAQSNSKIDSPSVNEAVANNLGQHIAPPPPGLPPLKPPPGRADLTKPVTSNPPPAPPSAPIPPTAASMRANVGPTPPPPPPLKSSSSAPRPLPPGPPAPPMQPSSAGSRPPPPPIKPSSGGPSPPPPGPPPPPIPSGGIKAGPRPPGPPPPPGLGAPRPPSLGPKPPRHAPNSSSSTSVNEDETGGPKTKLKPFFWDKVSANPDESMVWNQIKAGSFQFNEEMIESLFGYAAPAKGKNDAKKESQLQDPSIRSVKLIDQKKAQNLAIMLKALNVTTEEVCDAIEEGNELPPELIQTLIKMAPTADEELKLRLFDGELSQLGLAERFLKVLVSIPFAFKRLECLLFMCTLQEEASSLKETFVVLEAACAELRKNRLFLKLLEAVLKTGNRMNDGTFRGGAQAFKLDTLLKLSDVKGTDGKTTLLHFVVQEMIRSEGRRAARAARETRSLSSFKSDDFTEDIPEDSDEQLRNLGLEVVSGVGNELQNVKRAAVIDSESLTGTVSKLGHALVKARDFLNTDMKNVQADKGFHQVLKSFVQSAEVDVTSLLKEEKRIMELVKSTAGYFHGNTGKDEGLRLFVVVRDFLIILEKVCREVKNTPRKPNTTQKKDESVATPLDTKQTAPADPLRTIPADARQRLFPAITDRRMDSSSSDEED